MTRKCEKKAGYLGLLGVIATALFATCAQADAYRLVSQDRIALRVVEWRSGEAELKDWEVFNGTFLVDSSGKVALPLVGTIDAAGLTTDELAARIEDIFQKRSGLAKKPAASVEIAQYGPIFIMGAVDKPGQYPFIPDLTVMKAISLAGGFRKDDDPTRDSFERDRIQAVGNLGAANLDYDGLLMRRARLIAEKEQKTSFAVPAELDGKKEADGLHANEMALMHSHQVELDSKLAAAKSLGDLYDHEIQTLQDKTANQQRQVDLVQKELANVTSLVQRKLMSSDRRFLLDRDESESESKLLDLQFQMLRARQLREENARDMQGLLNSRNSDIQTELNDVSRQIDKAEFQVRISRLLVDAVGDESEQQPSAQLDASQKVIQYRIARKSADGSVIRTTATPDTPVEPRDLVEVIDGPLQSKLGEGDQPVAVELPKMTSR